MASQSFSILSFLCKNHLDIFQEKSNILNVLSKMLFMKGLILPHTCHAFYRSPLNFRILSVIAKMLSLVPKQMLVNNGIGEYFSVPSIYEYILGKTSNSSILKCSNFIITGCFIIISF